MWITKLPLSNWTLEPSVPMVFSFGRKRPLVQRENQASGACRQSWNVFYFRTRQSRDWQITLIHRTLGVMAHENAATAAGFAATFQTLTCTLLLLTDSVIVVLRTAALKTNFQCVPNFQLLSHQISDFSFPDSEMIRKSTIKVYLTIYVAAPLSRSSRSRCRSTPQIWKEGARDKSVHNQMSGCTLECTVRLEDEDWEVPVTSMIYGVT
ncbi:hypothetical protein F4604DRAFT_1683527 [Suillus subluteus]|nr:hypothetical protein F4604DRAFT_1683527 [Suillus subluteus]